MMTRGAISCVGKTATGLPDWTSSVSSRAETLELTDDGVKALPVARGLADAAVDDEVRGALGDFGVEIVHQAAQGSFLLPAFAAELVAARGVDDWGGCGGHGELLPVFQIENTTGDQALACFHTRLRWPDIY